MSGVKLLGYSERGILGSLFYEIKYHPNSNCLLNKLIGKSVFPFTDEKPLPADMATIFLEQSLSDFGDADAIVLASSGNKKHVVFIEAKVQTYGDICKTFQKFNCGLKNDYAFSGFTSNLFTQLFFKQKLVKHEIGKDKERAPFVNAFLTRAQQDSDTEGRSIGKNEVVLDVAEKIKSYSDSVFYLMLVPDSDQQAADFFDKILKRKDSEIKENLPEWDSTNFGYLTWKTVKTFCKCHKLKNTDAVFEHNGEQIFKET